MSPHSFQRAAVQRRDLLLQDAETWRQLRPVRQARARRLRHALAFALARLFQGRSNVRETTEKPATAGE